MKEIAKSLDIAKVFQEVDKMATAQPKAAPVVPRSDTLSMLEKTLEEQIQMVQKSHTNPMVSTSSFVLNFHL